jgi:hypothetical protein
MAKDPVRQTQNEEYPRIDRSKKPVVWIGWTAAVLVFCTICVVASPLCAWFESLRGLPHIVAFSRTDGLIFVGCIGSVMLFFRLKSPHPLEWGAPFTLFVFLAYLHAGFVGWHPDTPEEQRAADYALDTFYLCVSVWLLAIAVGVVRVLVRRKRGSLLK